MIDVNSRVVCALLGIFFFTLLDPYFLWKFELSKSFFYAAPFMFIIANNLRKFRAVDYGLFTLFFVVLLIAALSKRSNIFGLISMLCISILPFLDRVILVRSAQVFKRLYALTVFLGLKPIFKSFSELSR